MSERNYIRVNGLNMYHEVRGQGSQLVLVHGGGSSVETTFSRIMPHLTQQYRVLAMDFQGHGRAKVRAWCSGNTMPEDAEDVFTLMQQVGVNKAHLLGFGKGGASAHVFGCSSPLSR